MLRPLRVRWAFGVVISLHLFILASFVTAQEKPKDKKDKSKSAAVVATPAPAATDTAKSFQAALTNLKFREIGPATMGGRIDDIEAVPGDPRTIYVATAAGGILKSTNGGTSWVNLFDKESVSSIGDIAISPSNTSIIWAGSGEANNR